MTSHSGNQFSDMARDFMEFAPGDIPPVPDTTKFRFGEVFCGLGILSAAAVETFQMQLVFAHDPDADARRAYSANFGIEPWATIPERLDAGAHAIDVLLGRVPENPDDFDRVIAPVVRALRPRGVMLGASFAPLMDLTPDGMDLPTSEHGVIWTYFRKRMREMGYRVSRIAYNSGVIDPLELYEHRLFAATLSNREFPWRRVSIAVLPIPGSAEDLRHKEIRAAIARELGDEGKRYMWDVTETRAEQYRAWYKVGDAGDWSIPVDSPDFAELLECAQPFELAEAAVGIMAEFIGT